MLRSMVALWLLLAASPLTRAATGAESAPDPTPAPTAPAKPEPVSYALPGEVTALAWDAKRQGAFVTSLTEDRQGGLWAGTEGNGVWRFDPRTHAWTGFTTQNGLGDDYAYAMTCDKQGRVWVGHLNHGLSVYNGKAWRTYGILDGPLGSRVFAMACSPKDGSVWIGTEAGLTRYLPTSNTWAYYTTADGLPSDAIKCLAFNAAGDLFVGLQAHGLCIGRAAEGFRRWHGVRAVDPLPDTPAGEGIPSDFTTAVLAAPGGVVFLGTNSGLAVSRDNGKSWRYLRGADWRDKARNRTKDGKAPPAAFGPADALLEDYVTCLADDGKGQLWIGHRGHGFEVKDARSLYRSSNGLLGDTHVAALLTTRSGTMMIARYGGGVRAMNGTAHRYPQPLPAPAAGFPSPAAPPSSSVLARFANAIDKAAAIDNASWVAELPDDWATEGDWLGRYGRTWACLCAMRAPSDYIWGAGLEPLQYEAKMGPNHKDGDQMRAWVHWLYTEQGRSLEMPAVYLDTRKKLGLAQAGKPRRQSEWDDHGEAYPLWLDGPDINVRLWIPVGTYFVSLYDDNKDGHSANNRFRDYELTVRISHDEAQRCIGTVTANEKVKSRVFDFWGGVWKRLLVRGPCVLALHLSRAHSHNTILAGVMVDEAEEHVYPQGLLARAVTGGLGGQACATLSSNNGVGRLLASLEALKRTNGPYWAKASRKGYTLAARALVRSRKESRGDPQGISPVRSLATCWFYISGYTAWEGALQELGIESARVLEQALIWEQGMGDGSGRESSIMINRIAEELRNIAPRGATSPENNLSGDHTPR